ncbi:MAG: ATP-binding protein [Bdellovibrionia bacterium]
MRKVLGHSTFSFLFFGALLTLLVLQLYSHVQQAHLESEMQNSLKKAELVERKISEFVVSSQVVSQFVFEDIQVSQKLVQAEIEKKLHRYLKSSPSDIIYGIGIWFEPYRFDKNKKYFGPYVRRAENNSEITYEWDTADYDYHNQNWYKIGIKSGDLNTFVDPYFDTGLVFVSNVRSFYDQDKKLLGVITVDIVMPQLLEIIRSFNLNSESVLYIENRQGKLLAHPLQEKFLEKVREQGATKEVTLLDYNASDIQNLLQLDLNPKYRQQVTNNDLGWRVVVDVSESHVFGKIKDTKYALIYGIFIFWALVLYIEKIAADRKRESLESNKAMEIARAQLMQNAKMAALGEMAGSVAHEINNPLAIISGHAQMIKKDFIKEKHTPEQTIEKADRILKTVERINSIVRGLKTFARSGENDPMLLEPLEDIIKDSISFCEERLRLKSIELRISEVPKIFLNCRKSQMAQVIVNLVANSMDAISDIPEKWIQLDFEILENQKVKIYITDSGKGIPAEVAEKIMFPFFTTKEVGKGTGLGLSISKGIIEDHHGKLTYISDHPNTRFAIELTYEK